jgi:hypothetical protein
MCHALRGRVALACAGTARPVTVNFLTAARMRGTFFRHGSRRETRASDGNPRARVAAARGAAGTRLAARRGNRSGER